jgi:two-component system phosphate regulon sensor histidine kinase PhoR
MLTAYHYAQFKIKCDIFTAMKRKINYLIWGCSLAMLALTTVQVYFIYNTYVLKEKEAQSAVRLALIGMEERMNIDSIRAAYFTQGEVLLRSQGLRSAITFFSQGSPAMSKQVSKYILNNSVLNQYHTTYRVVFSTVSLSDLSGRKVELKDKLWFSNGKFSGKPSIISDLITDNNTGDGLIRNLKSRSIFSINDGKNVILREMLALMVFSVVLISSMILLFYFSIRSLIKQKKISDMQTDFINNITHEFNTPLATMAVALSTAKSQGENTIVSNAMSVIDRQHKRLKKLINQVVTHTSGSSELVLHKEKIPVEIFINRLLDDFQTAYPGITLIRKIEIAPLKSQQIPFL